MERMDERKFTKSMYITEVEAPKGRGRPERRQSQGAVEFIEGKNFRFRREKDKLKAKGRGRPERRQSQGVIEFIERKKFRFRREKNKLNIEGILHVRKGC